LKEKQRCLLLLSYRWWDDEIYSSGGGGEGPTVTIWESLESLSEHKKEIWLKREASTTHDWVVRCGHKNGRRKSAHLNLAAQKSSFIY